MASAVADATGKRLGTVVQWHDRTEEVQAEEEIRAAVAQAIEGDLGTRLVEDGKRGFFKALAADMNRLLHNVDAVMGQVKIAANEVSRGADEISQGNANLSYRTEEQASSLEETAASMEHMT